MSAERNGEQKTSTEEILLEKDLHVENLNEDINLKNECEVCNSV